MLSTITTFSYRFSDSPLVTQTNPDNGATVLKKVNQHEADTSNEAYLNRSVNRSLGGSCNILDNIDRERELAEKRRYSNKHVFM